MMTTETDDTKPAAAAGGQNELLVMRDQLAELVYCMERARPHLPHPSPTPGPKQRSALAARIDILIEDIYQTHRQAFESEVSAFGA